MPLLLIITGKVWMMRVRRYHATLAVTTGMIAGGAAVAPAAGAVPTSAASCVTQRWTTTGTAADAEGAYTHGIKCALDSGRVLIDVSIEDTREDGKDACAQLHATYASGRTRDEWAYVAGLGHTKSVTYTYAHSVRQIWVREGLGNHGRCTEMANGVHIIFQRS